MYVAWYLDLMGGGVTHWYGIWARFRGATDIKFASSHSRHQPPLLLLTGTPPPSKNSCLFRFKLTSHHLRTHKINSQSMVFMRCQMESNSLTNGDPTPPLVYGIRATNQGQTTTTWHRPYGTSNMWTWYVKYTYSYDTYSEQSHSWGGHIFKWNTNFKRINIRSPNGYTSNRVLKVVILR